MALHVESIRDPPTGGGQAFRVLVDPVLPEGRLREEARIDCWLPDLAPSDWLASRFGRDPARWGTFRSRYRRQLRSRRRAELLREIAEIARRRDVVLLHGSPDPHRNPAAVILETLLQSRSFHGRGPES